MMASWDAAEARRLLAAVGVVLATTLVAGCGATAPMGLAPAGAPAVHAHPAGGAPTLTASDPTVAIPLGASTMAMKGHGDHVLPQKLELVAGGSVLVRNEDRAMHYFFSQPIMPGETLRKAFPEPGTFTYQTTLSCSTPHQSSVMVVVRPAR